MAVKIVGENMIHSVRVWDAPTRLFHWALVFCVIGLVTTAQIGGAAMQWHFRLGYGVLSLLLFRLVWGFVGGYWSRFGSFLFGPRQVVDYLRGQGDPQLGVGHNPLGALSVFAMLFFLLLQVCSGLMSDDEIAATGPLVRYVSSEWVNQATFYHKNVGKVIILTLVATHLLAIAFYFFKKRDNLVRAMLRGDKTLSFHAKASEDGRAKRLLGLVIFTIGVVLVSAGVAWLDA